MPYIIKQFSSVHCRRYVLYMLKQSGFCLLLHTLYNIFLFSLRTSHSFFNKNTVTFFIFDKVGVYHKRCVSKISQFRRFLSIFKVGVALQVFLRGIGHAFKIFKRKFISQRFLKISIGLSKKFITLVSKSFHLRIHKKLKLFLRSRSLTRLTGFIARINLLKFRFFYKKFKGFASTFEKITILKMNKGI